MQNIYCKCIIYAFVSNLKIKNFSKAMDRHPLDGELMNWAIVGKGLAQVADKTSRWGFEKWEDTMQVYHASLSQYNDNIWLL